MLSAIYDYAILKVKSILRLESGTRKRRIEDEDCAESPNFKVRRTESPLGTRNFSGAVCHSVSTMSKFDESHIVYKDCPEEECSCAKRNMGKENQFLRTCRSQSSDSDVIVLDEDLGDVSHLKACSHDKRKCKGAHAKCFEDMPLRKTQLPQTEEVSIIDYDDEDVVFIRDTKSRDRGNNMPQHGFITFPRKIKEHRKPVTEERPRVRSGLRTSQLCFGHPSQNHVGGRMEQKSDSSIWKLDSPSVKSRIRNGNLSRAAVLRKSLPQPSSYFGVDAKLSSRWSGLDDKIQKKPSALKLCSAINEMEAYNHMLKQFASDFAPKQINMRYDSEPFKLFESQLRRNNYFSQLMRKEKEVGINRPRIFETIDLCDDDVEEVELLDEARGPFVEKKPDTDVVEIVYRKDSDASLVPKRVDIQRTRERTPKASGERIEADKKAAWTHPNAVEEMIKRNHVTDDKFLKNLVEKFDNERAKIGKELEKEHIRKSMLSEMRQKIESSLEERLMQYLRITLVSVKEEEIQSEEKEELPMLTEEMLDSVRGALKKGKTCVLACLGSNTITGGDIQTLGEACWLNDEVINNYMDMLTLRGQSSEYPSVYCFNTFFYPRLNTTGYSAIRRWTKKVDIFQKEILIIPVHLEIHWALAVVDFRQKSIRYYDSMNGNNKSILQLILKYLQEEKHDKKKENFDVSGWDLKLVKDIPQQRNGHDCGVFACIFAEHLSRGVVNKSQATSRCKHTYPPFPFSQENMPYFRSRMIYEILSGKLLQ